MFCPECNRMFNRAASLGVHRRRAHGVIGARNAKRQEALAADAVETPRLTNVTVSGINRDGLLEVLYPTGRIPASTKTIARLNEWLERAEELVAV